MNGFLLIDKPRGLTSHDVVDALRKKFNPSKKQKNFKIGHTGTLDPFATGLLVMGVGEALKFVNYLQEEPKVYEATLKLGVATDTLDCEGKEIETKPIPSLSEEGLQKIFSQFIGHQLQTPPMFSAKKIDGKKLYELARAGIEVERKAVDIEIYGMELFEDQRLFESSFSFRVSCSRGTYVRVLGADIAKALGTVGHLTQLRRLKAGSFDVAQASDSSLVSIESALSHWPRVELSEEETTHILHGRKIKKLVENNASFYTLFSNNLFLGLGRIEHEFLLPVRLLS